MAQINLTISKQDFDAAVPAAKEPKGIVFARMEPFIRSEMQQLCNSVLGDIGITFVNNNQESETAKMVKGVVCMKALANNMRSMDLVLTPTGFGVVSTNDTAPASKMRVDALDGELRVNILKAEGSLLQELFKVSRWYQSGCYILDTLFYHFDFLTRFAGMQSPVAKDWEAAHPLIVEADAAIRNRISDEYMEELIRKECTATYSTADLTVIFQIRRIIGSAIRGDRATAEEYLRRLICNMERNLEAFETYASSQAYRVNHYEPYKNTQESGTFHFVG